MIGMVLAAGGGQRLRPLTDDLPKTLLPVDSGRSILEIIVANLKAVGLERIVIITGHRAERIEEAVPSLEERHGVTLELVFNPHAETKNNAYSLWCARHAFERGVLLVNGDTVHEPSLETQLLDGRQGEITLAVDRVKPLGDEEMKVRLGEDGAVQQINKKIDPDQAHGEYIGLTVIEPVAARRLAEALEYTWRNDPSLYYEDGFQEFLERQGRVHAAPIENTRWVEVDDPRDLERAREIACHC